LQAIKCRKLTALPWRHYEHGVFMKLRDEAFHLLRQLFQRHTSHWQQVLPTLTKPQYAVMRAIAEHPGIEQVALTEVAVSTKATLAEMLNRMETRDLVERRPDPQDKRRRFVFLTPRGNALLRESLPLGESVDAAFLGRLSSHEREQFCALIRKMMD